MSLQRRPFYPTSDEPTWNKASKQRTMCILVCKRNLKKSFMQLSAGDFTPYVLRSVCQGATVIIDSRYQPPKVVRKTFGPGTWQYTGCDLPLWEMLPERTIWSSNQNIIGYFSSPSTSWWEMIFYCVIAPHACHITVLVSVTHYVSLLAMLEKNGLFWSLSVRAVHSKKASSNHRHQQWELR